MRSHFGFWSRLFSLVILLSATSACDATRCGPGTVERDGICSVVDAGAPDTGGPDAGLPDMTMADSSEDAPLADASIPDASEDTGSGECGPSDEAICATPTRRQICGLPTADACPMAQRCREEIIGGVTHAACVPEGSPPCDERGQRCEDGVAIYCNETDGVRWSSTRDCGERGPGGVCAIVDGRPQCQTESCDSVTYVPTCASSGRAVICEFDAQLYSDCADSFRCIEGETSNPVAACIPTGAVESAFGPSANPQVVSCTARGLAVIERYGWQWEEACEPVVVFVDGAPSTIPTRCVEREGEADCIRMDRPATCEGGWECSDRGDLDCVDGEDGADTSRFSCGSGCVTSTARCHDSTRCMTDTFVEETIGTTSICCSDTDGNGVGVTVAWEGSRCPG